MSHTRARRLVIPALTGAVAVTGLAVCILSVLIPTIRHIGA